MGPKYEHFKFELGQIVQQRINAEHDRRKMIIMERLVQECPGGVQIHYKCRPQREMPQNYLENELEEYKPDAPWSDPDIEVMMRERIERRRQREETAKHAAQVPPVTPENQT